MIYMVEHNFAGDAKTEAAWNEWYSNHATYSFRKVPRWRTGQRFRSLNGDGPKYRAMYTVEDEAVLTSPEYKTTTGGRFPEEWRSLATDFHRDLADLEWMPAVPMDQLLVVLDPPADPGAIAGASFQRSRIVGLDKSVPWRALAIVDKASGEEIARKKIAGVSVYTPVFERWMV